jgi:hypothetical protein
VSVLFYGRSRMREERPWAWCEVRSMSRHFFMTSAHTPWNRRHWPWPCPPPFVTSSAQPRSSRSRPIAAIEVSGNQATRRRAAGPCSPTLASPCSQTSGTRTGTPVRANMGIFHPIPFTGISVERHLSRIVHVSLGHSLGASPAPGGTSGSAFAGLLPQPRALGPHSGKSTLGTWERGTSRRFAQECPE